MLHVDLLVQRVVDHPIARHPPARDDRPADPARDVGEHALDDPHHSHAHQIIVQHRRAHEHGVEDPYLRPGCPLRDVGCIDPREPLEEQQERRAVRHPRIALAVLLPDIPQHLHPAMRLRDPRRHRRHRAAEEVDGEIELHLRLDEVFLLERSVRERGEVRIVCVGALFENLADQRIHARSPPYARSATAIDE